jgi:hypothetical protein
MPAAEPQSAVAWRRRLRFVAAAAFGIFMVGGVAFYGANQRGVTSPSPSGSSEGLRIAASSPDDVPSSTNAPMQTAGVTAPQGSAEPLVLKGAAAIGPKHKPMAATGADSLATSPVTHTAGATAPWIGNDIYGNRK